MAAANKKRRVALGIRNGARQNAQFVLYRCYAGGRCVRTGTDGPGFGVAVTGCTVSDDVDDAFDENELAAGKAVSSLLRGPAGVCTLACALDTIGWFGGGRSTSVTRTPAKGTCAVQWLATATGGRQQLRDVVAQSFRPAVLVGSAAAFGKQCSNRAISAKGMQCGARCAARSVCARSHTHVHDVQRVALVAAAHEQSARL